MASKAAPSTTSPSPGPSTGPANRHAPTAVERQRLHLDKLLKDPAKPVHIPAAPKEKTLRPAREMMKNVQGSSAGAGSGEFHVYKASRRREYERLKMMDETVQKEAAAKEFEEKKRKWEEEANSKTAKNRAKRMKKKEKTKVKDASADDAGPGIAGGPSQSSSKPDAPLKKRRIVNGAAMVFRKPGEESDEDSEPGEGLADTQDEDGAVDPSPPETHVEVAETAKITFHDDE